MSLHKIDLKVNGLQIWVESDDRLTNDRSRYEVCAVEETLQTAIERLSPYSVPINQEHKP